jgi:hypothetical protein
MSDYIIGVKSDNMYCSLHRKGLRKVLKDQGKIRIVNKNPSRGMYEIPCNELSHFFDLEDRTIRDWTMWISSENRPHAFKVNSRFWSKVGGSWKKEYLGEFDATRYFIPNASSTITLRELLSELNRSHFYIMHLSYEGEDRERLWNHARKNNIVGLSNSYVSGYWLDVEKWARSRLDGTWIHQFDLFCKDMELGDIILVLDGCARLLGVGQTRENDARYSKRFSRVFFDHIRYVSWIITHDFDASAPLRYPLDRFTNTLSKVEKGKKYWNELSPLQLRFIQRPNNQLEQAKKSQVLRIRKHDVGGEGPEHVKLKNWIAKNPQLLGLHDVRNKKIEYVFPSGDCADIVFELMNNRYVVVEIETSDALPGCYQALKYRTLKCAELGLPLTSARVEAKVVAWNFEPFVKDFCSHYGIGTYKQELPKA